MCWSRSEAYELAPRPVEQASPGGTVIRGCGAGRPHVRAGGPLMRADPSRRPESAVASTDPIPREGRMSRPVIRSDGRTESLSFDCPLASARVPPCTHATTRCARTTPPHSLSTRIPVAPRKVGLPVLGIRVFGGLRPGIVAGRPARPDPCTRPGRAPRFAAHRILYGGEEIWVDGAQGRSGTPSSGFPWRPDRESRPRANGPETGRKPPPRDSPGYVARHRWYVRARRIGYARQRRWSPCFPAAEPSKIPDGGGHGP